MFREGAVEKRRDDRWEAVKRRVQLLSRLDGKPVLLVEGVHVATPELVRDADLVIITLRKSGVLDRETFERAFASERPPVAITREVLATAHRDLRALATAPALATARDRRRALARYGSIDEAWLKAEIDKGVESLDAGRGRVWSVEAAKERLRSRLSAEGRSV